jgi:hypothetical protein
MEPPNEKHGFGNKFYNMFFNLTVQFKFLSD